MPDGFGREVGNGSTHHQESGSLGEGNEAVGSARDPPLRGETRPRSTIRT